MDKKSTGMFVFLSSILLCMLCVGMFFWGDTQNTNTEKESLTQKYILSSFNGRLACFEAGYAEPMHIFDTYICDLPDSDREKLQNGISVNNTEELMSLVEDFES